MVTDHSTVCLPSGRRMCRLMDWNPRLPQELLDAIVDIVGSWPATENPNQTLKSLSLVSHSFAYSSRRHAFGSLTIHNGNALSFFELLKSPCCTLRRCKTSIWVEELDFYSHRRKRQEWLHAGIALPEDARAFVRGITADIGNYGQEGAQALMDHLSILFPHTKTLRIFQDMYMSLIDLSNWVAPFAKLESLRLDQYEDDPALDSSEGEESEDGDDDDDAEGEQSGEEEDGSEVGDEDDDADDAEDVHSNDEEDRSEDGHSEGEEEVSPAAEAVEESEDGAVPAVVCMSSSVLMPPPQPLKELVVFDNIINLGLGHLLDWLAAAEPSVKLAELHFIFHGVRSEVEERSLALAAASYLNLCSSTLAHLWIDDLRESLIDLLLPRVSWSTFT
ncbi:hypothetical protein HGRIS_008493 [Hohenbuehelia grisea]|uniref:Uncharacterized protein n=1 Tax=Hohenbuehelia grisea TaxID=104357 RepID=A0ABR3J8F8_9AGAR